MKNTGANYRKSGVLRGVCGVSFLNTPQRNSLSNKAPRGVRYVAGCYLYPRARRRAYTRAHARVTPKQTPQLPATGPNSLNDSLLGCGVSPLDIPQTHRRHPANRYHGQEVGHAQH